MGHVALGIRRPLNGACREARCSLEFHVKTSLEVTVASHTIELNMHGL